MTARQIIHKDFRVALFLCAVSKVTLQLKRRRFIRIIRKASAVNHILPLIYILKVVPRETLFILGYHYWKYFADYVGLRDESQNWEQSDNPAEKFLKAFSEMEHSTIGKLIEASEKTAGLSLFVSELKNKFSEANQSGRVENLAPNGSTWV